MEYIFNDVRVKKKKYLNYPPRRRKRGKRFILHLVDTFGISKDMNLNFLKLSMKIPKYQILNITLTVLKGFYTLKELQPIFS